MPADERWLAADWPAPPGVVAGSTLRGGTGKDAFGAFNLAAHVDDAPGAVAANRARLRDELGLPSEPCWLRQVHGTRVVRAPLAGDEPEADACVTDAPGIVCAVLTADCLPVLLAARTGDAVGAVHAGWRGLAAGVVEAAVGALDRPPGDLVAWLGPAISQPAFEVGDEVRESFVGADAGAAACFARNARGRWQADLYGLARLRLAAAGVTDVHGRVRCTWADPERYYSYRRDGRCGRMASLVYFGGGGA